jgi:hypothetical protein
LATTVFRPFFISPERGAKTILYLAASPEVEATSGRYFVQGRSVKSSRASYDVALAKKLWTTSEWLTGLYDTNPKLLGRGEPYDNSSLIKTDLS